MMILHLVVDCISASTGVLLGPRSPQLVIAGVCSRLAIRYYENIIV